MKNIKTAIVSAIAVVALGTIIGLKSCNTQQKQVIVSAKKTPHKPYYAYFKAINTEVDISFSHYTFNSETNFVLKHPSGTEITFEKGCLVDKDGNKITGEVTIKYREFMNKQELLGAGIPMRLKNDDYSSYLVSSGMMEVYALQNGNEIFINNEKPISVKLANTTSENGYNAYYLDTNKREWIETQKEVKPVITKIVTTIKKALKPKNENINEEDALAKGYINPIKPEKARKNKYQFKFKINLQPFPEMNIYDGIMFEYAGNSKAEDPENNAWVKTQFWNEMKLVKTPQKGIYTLLLSTPEKTFKTTVNPVFDAEDMEYAMDVFTDRYNRYRKYVDKKKTDKIEYETRQQTNLFVSRSFEINKFGVWNTDKLEILDETIPMIVKLSHTDTSIKFLRAYLLLTDNKGVLDLEVNNNQINKFKYPKNKGAKVLLSDKAGKCYLLDKKQMNKLAQYGEYGVFMVKQRGVEVKNESDIKKVMG